MRNTNLTAAVEITTWNSMLMIHPKYHMEKQKTNNNRLYQRHLFSRRKKTSISLEIWAKATSKKFPRVNESSRKHVCVLGNSLADGRRSPGFRYCEKHFTCLITFISHDDTLREVSHEFYHSDRKTWSLAILANLSKVTELIKSTKGFTSSYNGLHSQYF